MFYCMNCGKPINDNNKICSLCGNNQLDFLIPQNDQIAEDAKREQLNIPASSIVAEHTITPDLNARLIQFLDNFNKKADSISGGRKLVYIGLAGIVIGLFSLIVQPSKAVISPKELSNAEISKISIMCLDTSKAKVFFNFVLYEKERGIVTVQKFDSFEAFNNNEKGFVYTFYGKYPSPPDGVILSLNSFISEQGGMNKRSMVFAVVDPLKTGQEQADDVMVFESIGDVSNIINKFYCYEVAKKLSAYISK